MPRENLHNSLPIGSYAYIPINKSNIKIEILDQEQQLRGLNQPYGFFLYIDLESPFSSSKSDVYKLRVQKKQNSANVVPHYHIVETENNIRELRKILDPILDDISKGERSNFAEYFIKYDDITKENSKHSDDDSHNKKKYTIAHVPKVIPQDQQQQDTFNFFISPDDELLLHLTSFSEMYNPIYTSTPNKLVIKDYDEAQARLIEIFEEFSVTDEQLRKDIRLAFNFDKYYTGHIDDVSSGAILFGPPGTGKTFMVMNVIEKMCREILGFGFVDENMAEILGSSDSKYVGAALRAVNRILMPSIEDAISKQRPVIVFVDEGDKLVKDDDQYGADEGIAGMKNLINPKNYPGLMVCICTNLENKKMNKGISGRRLEEIEIGYPDVKRATAVWEAKKKTLFGRDENGQVIEGNLTTEDYENLASIIAGNAGLDTIDRHIRNYTGGSPVGKQEIDFGDFRLEFCKTVMKRVNSLRDEEMENLTKFDKGRLYQEEIDYVQNKFSEQIERINEAMRGEKKRDSRQVINQLSEPGENNLFFIEYNEFYNLYIRTFNTRDSYDLILDIFENSGRKYRDDEKQLIIDIYRRLDFLLETLGSNPPAIPSEYQQIFKSPSGEGGPTLEQLLTQYMNLIKIVILNIGDEKEIISTIPELFGQKPNGIPSSNVRGLLVALRRVLPDSIPTIEGQTSKRGFFGLGKSNKKPITQEQKNAEAEDISAILYTDIDMRRLYEAKTLGDLFSNMQEQEGEILASNEAGYEKIQRFIDIRTTEINRLKAKFEINGEQIIFNLEAKNGLKRPIEIKSRRGKILCIRLMRKLTSINMKKITDINQKLEKIKKLFERSI